MTEVKQVLDALKRTLERIYEERGLALEVSCADELKFRGEKQDFEEMVGNLARQCLQMGEGAGAGKRRQRCGHAHCRRR